MRVQFGEGHGIPEPTDPKTHLAPTDSGDQRLKDGQISTVQYLHATILASYALSRLDFHQETNGDDPHRGGSCGQE